MDPPPPEAPTCPGGDVPIVYKLAADVQHQSVSIRLRAQRWPRPTSEQVESLGEPTIHQPDSARSDHNSLSLPNISSPPEIHPPSPAVLLQAPGLLAGFPRTVSVHKVCVYKYIPTALICIIKLKIRDFFFLPDARYEYVAVIQSSAEPVGPVL